MINNWKVKYVDKKRITVDILNSYRFLKVPKELIFNLEKYSQLSVEGILAYSLLFDRLEMSAKNGWVNENGEIYIKFKKDVISKLVRVKSKATITNVFKELKDNELIEERRVGCNQANEIYILQTEFSETQISDEEILNLSKNELESNKNYGSSKIERPKNEPSEVQKLNTNETNITKTNILKEEETFQVAEEIIEVYKNNISKTIGDIELRILECFQKKTNKNMVIKALEVAAMKNGKNISYIQAILNDWIERGLKTNEEVDTYLANWLSLNKRAKRNREEQIKKKAEDISFNSKSKVGSFNDYDQRKYNYDDLEKKLLGWDKE